MFDQNGLNQSRYNRAEPMNLLNTGGPRYSVFFYLQIRLFTLDKMIQNDNFSVKMDLLSANSRFEVQNDGTYLPRITRETCIVKSAPNLINLGRFKEVAFKNRGTP